MIKYAFHQYEDERW